MEGTAAAELTDGLPVLGMPAQVLDVDVTTGLTEEEVAQRRARGLGNDAQVRTGRGYLEIVRENAFTFTNNIIFLLGVGLILVGRPFDALISVLVVGTNVVVGVAQETRAKRTLDRISLLTQPTALVVRDGITKTVPPTELVIGDLVQVGAGDQFVLDGKLVSGRLQADESLLTGESDLILKQPADAVFSGSFAASGSGRYIVEHVGTASLSNRITEGARAFRRVLTPLQQQVNTVIRVALLMVVYMEVLLIATSVVHVVSMGDSVAQAAVVAGLIPNGLFVSIAVAYALGAVRLVRFGALVQQSNAIESLSRVDVLCTDKTGTLTANRLSVREVIALDGDEAQLRQALAEMVASASERNKTAEAIAAAIPGVARPLLVDVPFSSARKWSGVAFEGGPTHVLGAPQNLSAAIAEAPDGHPEARSSIERLVIERASQGLRVLLFISHPGSDAITGNDDAAQLKDGFRPLGLVVLEDELRQGVGEILERFISAGVSVKIISGDDPDTVVALARQAGLSGELPMLSGVELDGMDDAALGQATRKTVVFGRITPAQKERLVGTLRAAGYYVAMIGDGVNDVLSLKKADLAVAMASGSQATRAVADIVLTNDSFGALAPAVEEGQRIVNGMFDILGLFLARIATMGLVILSALVIGVFPIGLRNASAITLFSVGIPAVFLAVWAQPGAITHESIGRTMLRFVLPAAMISSLGGLVVLFGTLWLLTGSTPQVGLSPSEQAAAIAGALPVAQSALAAFLVLVGVGLIVYVEPPTKWLSVVQSKCYDWRPTILAGVLLIAFLVLAIVEPLGNIFALVPLNGATWLLVVATFAAWFLLLRAVWRYRLIDRFVGL